MNNIHDSFLKETLKDKENGMSFLNVCMPHEVINVLSLSTLEITNDTLYLMN